MSALERHVCTVVSVQLGREDVHPDMPFVVGANCSFRDLRRIAYYLSRERALPDFDRVHWEVWLSVADVILAVEKAEQRVAQEKAA